MNDKIRGVIARFGNLSVDVSTLDDRTNLYDAGLTSHASVNVMLALEEEFEIEFPDELLRQSTFESVASIHAALATIGVEAHQV